MIFILSFMAALVIASGIYVGTIRGVTWLMRRIYNARNCKRKTGIYKPVKI